MGEVGLARYERRRGTSRHYFPHTRPQGFYATVTVRDPPNHTSSLRVKRLLKIMFNTVKPTHVILASIIKRTSILKIELFHWQVAM